MQNIPVPTVEAKEPKAAVPDGVQPSSEGTVIPRWKRVLDISLIVAGVPLWAPVAVLIALVIKGVSRGPVLFQQQRIGFLGRPFVCFKFRTMRMNAVAEVHQGYLKTLMHSDRPMTKMDLMGDSRLIPLGSILRSSGLDELPQLINVLRGEMSLVGPRPCLPYEYANYLPWQKQRFNSLPGLTGLWQVNGKNKTTFDQMIRMDISYTERKCLGLDLAIILKTFPAIILQVMELVARRKRSPKAVSGHHEASEP